MKLGAAFAFGLAVGLAILGLAGRGASDDGPETPIGPRWWPSEWGADDQRGAANRLTLRIGIESRLLTRLQAEAIQTPLLQARISTLQSVLQADQAALQALQDEIALLQGQIALLFG